MKKTACWLILAVLLFVPGRGAYADDGSMHDRLIIGQNFTLKSGETIDGNLVVVGGETAIEANAPVAGGLGVLGGSLRLAGEAMGSALVIGGSASLGEAAAVGSDLVALGGSFA